METQEEERDWQEDSQVRRPTIQLLAVDTVVGGKLSDLT